MKKLAIVLGVLFGLLLAAVVAIPFFVDVDKYRPEIAQAVNSKIRGTFELGKLKLSLWGRIRVDIGGLSVKTRAGAQVLKVGEASLDIPLMPILKGAPEVTLRMVRPELFVRRPAQGDWELLSLMPEFSETAPPGGNPPGGAPSGGTGGKSTALPAMAVAARVNLALIDADVKVDDLKGGMKTEIDRLEWRVFDLGLSRPVRTELRGEIAGRFGKQLKLEGPLVLKAKAEPAGKPGQWENLRAQIAFNADDIRLEVPGLFAKKAGDAARVEIDLDVSPQELKVARLEMAVLNVQASGQAVMSRSASGSVVRASLNSKPVDLKAWPQWVPMLKEYDLGGNLSFDAKVEGPVEKYGYRANVRLQGLTAKAPKLKGQPKIDGELVVSTDQIERMNLALAAPGADLRVTGKVVSFSKPRFDLDIQSRGLDIDKMVDLPPPAKKSESAAAAPSGGGGSGGGGKAAAEEDLDELVDPIRKNAALAGASGVIRAKIDSITMRGVKTEQIVSTLTYKDLVLALERFDLGIWKGKIGMSFKADLKPKAPTYSFSTKVDGLDMKSAMESQYELFKNTLVGRAAFEVNGSGASFNTKAAKRNLKMKGRAEVRDPVFQTIDIAKVAREAINGALSKAAATVPALAGKELQPIPGSATKYEFFGGEFNAADGVFRMPTFEARSAGQGLDLSGNLTYGLLDEKIDATVQVIDKHDLTGGRKLSAVVANCPVNHLISEGDGPVRLPIHVGCTMASPCVDSLGAAGHFAKVAADNVRVSAEACAKAEAKRQANEAIKRAIPNAPPALQDLQKRWLGQ